MNKSLMAAVAQSIAETRVELKSELDRIRDSLPVDKSDLLLNEISKTNEFALSEIGKAFDRMTLRQDGMKTDLLLTLKQNDDLIDHEINELKSQVTSFNEKMLNDSQSLRDELKSEIGSIIGNHQALVGQVDVEFSARDKQLSTVIEQINKSVEDGLNRLDQANNDTLLLVSEQLSELREMKSTPGPVGEPGAGIDSPYWQQKIYRSGSVVQHYLGQYFKSVVDTNAEPGSSSDWERVGSSGLRHRGGFKEDVTYSPGDIYSKDFGSFLVKDDGSHVLLSARGAKGPKGDMGSRGPIGERGIIGEAGATIKAVHADDRGFVFETTDNRMLPVKFDGLITREALLHSIEDATDFASLKRSLVFLCGGAQ